MINISNLGKYIRDTVDKRIAFIWRAPRRELIKSSLVVALLAAAGMGFNTELGFYLDVAETRCLPESLYLGYPRKATIETGDIVSFQADKSMMFGLMAGKRIAKLVAGVQGDYVVSNDKGAFVNGRAVGVRNVLTLYNLKKLGKSPVKIDRVLQPGELFVVGTLPRSFDSRYWGILQDSRVDRLVLALL